MRSEWGGGREEWESASRHRVGSLAPLLSGLWSRSKLRGGYILIGARRYSVITRAVCLFASLLSGSRRSVSVYGIFGYPWTRRKKVLEGKAKSWKKREMIETRILERGGSGCWVRCLRKREKNWGKKWQGLVHGSRGSGWRRGTNSYTWKSSREAQKMKNFSL